MWQMAAAQGAQALGQALGGPVQSESSSTSPFSGGMFDSSGWNVNFGSGSIKSDREQTDSTTDGLTPYLPYVVMAVVGLVALRYLKNQKG